MFADIAGSTALIHSMADPEAAQDLLEPIVSAMARSVEQHGGTICRIMGDGLVALFGAPLALEDHALRACEAALEMQAAASAHTGWRQAGAGDIRVRVGINSGEVVAKRVIGGSRNDYDATGSAVNVAARMEQTAKPGTIQLTGDTLEYIQTLYSLFLPAS